MLIKPTAKHDEHSSERLPRPIGNSRFLHPPWLQWWLVCVLMLVPATVVHFTGYNSRLPYRVGDVIDENARFVTALSWRGIDSPGLNYATGYPPIIIILDVLGQVVAERLTNQPTLDVTAEAVAIVRGLGVVIMLLTGIVLGLTARRLSGALIGWATIAAWLLLPGPILHSSEALSDPWFLFGIAATLYCSVSVFTGTWWGWAAFALISSMFAFFAKYSAFPMIGIALLPTVFVVAQKRPKWRTTLVIEAAAVLFSLLVVFVIYPIQTFADGMGREDAQNVANSGVSRALDIVTGIRLIAAGFTQTGMVLWVVAALMIIGSYLYWRHNRHKPNHIIAYLLVAATGFVMAWVPIIHINNIASVQDPNGGRYNLPALIGFLPMVVIGASLVCERLAQRFKHLRDGAVLFGVFCLMWLIPQTAISLDIVRYRALPDTRAAAMLWSLTGLKDGAIIVPEKAATFIYSKEWGGWAGRYIVFLGRPVTEHNLAYWREQNVNYALIRDEDILKYRGVPGFANEYMDHMLLLKHFPGSNERNSPWVGPEMGMYRLGAMQNKTNIHFGNSIQLAGYDISPLRPHNGDVVKLTFYWRANQRPTDNYNVYLHLYPINSRDVHAQIDGAPAGTQRPMLSWTDPQETLVSPEFELRIPAVLAQGCYRLGIGLYNYQTGERLPVEEEDYVVLRSFCIASQIF
jgi:hypothetical protein